MFDKIIEINLLCKFNSILFLKIMIILKIVSNDTMEFNNFNESLGKLNFKLEMVIKRLKKISIINLIF